MTALYFGISLSRRNDDTHGERTISILLGTNSADIDTTALRFSISFLQIPCQISKHIKPILSSLFISCEMQQKDQVHVSRRI